MDPVRTHVVGALASAIGCDARRRLVRAAPGAARTWHLVRRRRLVRPPFCHRFAASTSRDRCGGREALSWCRTLSVRLSCVRKLVDESLAQFESSKAPIRSVSRDFYDIFTDYGELVKLLLEASCLSDKTKTRAQETFALLKEELARERGFVAGVLALPEDTIDELPSRAFADFVVPPRAARSRCEPSGSLLG